MSFPYSNEHQGEALVLDLDIGGATTHAALKSAEYPVFMVGRPVDVSGMEIAVAIVLAAGTAGAVGIASGTTTVVLKPYDGGTSASAASDNNELFAVTDFSNSITGGWTAHQARKAVGTSTTDLDADDWVNLDVAANLTTVAGLGSVILASFFVYGVPGSPA